ncbi:GNAT family N-acetyltransferase [Nitrosomonas sp. JL21]|uniref:GNAT family N-acetyltransferase n=1 Tax=Nitrosomonas sp. JL21 TaxID=153949 RepID=UPI00136B3F64|nr:GNAT family N-acetyltransferase [Nitrosomonas sp. JL21]MBL8497070.1 GNAT family N-acetyltransferase [Nitrosomonas sp.]MXS78442.1 GNAT family N-acetyltransferase [Nitrosomonas sp. JL21]
MKPDASCYSSEEKRKELPVKFLSFPDQTCHAVTYEDHLLCVQENASGKQTSWRLAQQFGQLKLTWNGSCSNQPGISELLTAVEAAFSSYPLYGVLVLSVPFQPSAELVNSGVLILDQDHQFKVYADMFWQQARLWRCSSLQNCFPIHYMFTREHRHPLRPPKPEGVVYRRYIPWLSRTLIFRTVDLAVGDLECFHRWMNDSEVAKFWQESGDIDRHRSYLAEIHADPHVTSLIACLDEEPFGYFEVYWAKENRIAPYYDVDDFDRGWHVLIGEPHRRGKPFVTAWLPSISHYLFLDDARTKRLVIEPRSDNHKMIRNLIQCGYVTLKEFDFPHKRAVLGMLSRERFFSEQCWVPHLTSAPCLPSLS